MPPIVASSVSMLIHCLTPSPPVVSGCTDEPPFSATTHPSLASSAQPLVSGNAGARSFYERHGWVDDGAQVSSAPAETGRGRTRASPCRASNRAAAGWSSCWVMVLRERAPRRHLWASGSHDELFRVGCWRSVGRSSSCATSSSWAVVASTRSPTVPRACLAVCCRSGCMTWHGSA